MKITVKATDIELTPHLENLVKRKLNSLEKFSDAYIECYAEVGRTTEHHRSGPVYRAEADILLPGKVLRAEAANRSLNIAINNVKDELQRQIKEYKGQPEAKEKRGALFAKKMGRLSRFARRGKKRK